MPSLASHVCVQPRLLFHPLEVLRLLPRWRSRAEAEVGQADGLQDQWPLCKLPAAAGARASAHLTCMQPPSAGPPLILPAEKRRLCLPGHIFGRARHVLQHRVEQRARDALVALALTVGAMRLLLGSFAAPTTDACDSGIVQYTCRRCNER